MADPITEHDSLKRRCPMLGHDLAFSYCRAPGRELPCGKIFDCWWETFDVESFVRAHFTEEQVGQILAPREDKLVSLLEQIERAKAAGTSKPKDE